MGYYQEKTGEGFISTVDCAERERMVVSLPEEGNCNTEFYSKNGTLLAKGYLRVVYGDHGPYIEFLPEHMNRKAWYWSKKKGTYAYYQECQPKDGSYCLLYVQQRDVKNLPNPPQTGKWQIRKNRKEGYADYRIGRLYISPEQLIYYY